MTSSTPGLSRRAILRGGVGALAAGLAGCTGTGSTDGTATGASDTGGTAESASTDAADAREDWRAVELTDIVTGSSFTVGQFSGQPVLLESFAVWCPVCTDQQRQMGDLLDQRDDVVVISINVDPNEDAEQVREHVAEHDFDWRYAVAPSSMTRALIDEFGPVISNAPAAPVVRVCPDGTAALVEGRGVKSADALQAAFEQC